MELSKKQAALSPETDDEALKRRNALLEKYRRQNRTRSKTRSSRPHNLVKKKRKKYKHNRPDAETQQYKDFVKAVKARDKNRCQFPGCKKHTFGIEVHHIYRH